ncbi:MAG: DUF4124 domain-containing protein, partial [Rubrivivax sp.]|nr:DUF4124 domain-containing protein [Rubrivivax sp.]
MRLIVFMLAALASGQAGAQSVHRCTDANGQPVFQQAPCPAGTGRPVVIQAPNVVDGSPAGDAMLRAQAQRRA